MLIKTDGKTLANSVKFMATAPMLANEAEAKKVQSKDGGEGMPKLAPNGKPVHRAHMIALRLNEHGIAAGTEQNVFIGVIEPSDYELGARYVCDGETWVTHFITNDRRLGVSITVERLVPENPPAAAPKINKPEGN